MEGRIRSLLLGCTASVFFFFNTPLYAVDLADDQAINPIIQPEIERMDFEESRINADNIEVVASLGILSIENFGVNPVYGAKVAYRVSEGFFIDAELGLSTAGKTTAESIFNVNLISDSDREYRYITFNLGYDVFPGEAFITDGVTYNTAFYVVAGLGDTSFAGADKFTFSWGAGYRLLASNSLAVYFDIRDHTFNLELAGEKNLTNNIEISVGFGMYF